MLKSVHPVILALVSFMLVILMGYVVISQIILFFGFPKTVISKSDTTSLTGIDYGKKLREFELEENLGVAFENNYDQDISKALVFLRDRIDTYDWNEFDFTNDYIFAQYVPSVQEEDNILVRIVLPADMTFSYKNNPDGLSAKINCLEDKSVILDQFMEKAIQNRVSAVSLFKNGGYTLVSKCVNIECSELGPVCLLVPFGNPGEAKVYEFN